MNAAEARKLSNLHQPRLVEKQANEIALNINQNIKKATNEGEFSASTSIGFPTKNVDLILNNVKAYFESLDYKVNVFKFDEYISIVVSWNK